MTKANAVKMLRDMIECFYRTASKGRRQGVVGQFPTKRTIQVLRQNKQGAYSQWLSVAIHFMATAYGIQSIDFGIGCSSTALYCCHSSKLNKKRPLWHLKIKLYWVVACSMDHDFDSGNDATSIASKQINVWISEREEIKCMILIGY